MAESMCTMLRLILLLGILTRGIKSVDLPNKEWWETTLVYQIWPRGFQDSNGDGEGDLKGIINKLDYIKELGVDTIWLNPIYESPLVDSGYDVSDHKYINPLFGNREDFDTLVKKAHNLGIKVILDIIPNHSSIEHLWFRLSASNHEDYNNYYIWSDGKVDEEGNRIPPNNWVSTYNKDKKGSAWTWHNIKNKWYYHKFHEKQPDLNLRNKSVIDELLDIFEFWLGKGVDGFHIDSVPYFFEDEELRNEPSVGSGNYTFGLKESTELLYVFRAYINNWVEINNASSKLLIAESYDSDYNLIAYYGNATHEGIEPTNVRFINPIHNKTDASYIKNVIDEWFQLLPENESTNWMLSNHDFSRVPTRIGLNRVDGLHMLSLLLPGQAYTYYGEEIAMLDSRISWDRTIDPMGCGQTSDTYENFSRDPARTPMQWNNKLSAGFSTNITTYLPVHPEYAIRNVEYQKAQKHSNLNTYKKLAKLRKEPVFTHGDYELKSTNNNNVLILKRSLQDHPIYIIIVNLWIHREQINLTSLYPDINDNLEIIVYSSNAIYTTNTVSKSNFMLTANAALVLRGKANSKSTTSPPTSTVPTISTKSTTDNTASSSTDTTISSIKPSDKTTSSTTNKSETPQTDSTESTTKNPGSTTTNSTINTTTDKSGTSPTDNTKSTTTSETSQTNSTSTTTSKTPQTDSTSTTTPKTPQTTTDSNNYSEVTTASTFLFILVTTLTVIIFPEFLIILYNNI
ncbi:PREDICTED: maltase A3-like [Polistes canadensis]|uniref:maltase A3-like n=1 Tax=Polistes canadensis TaxID=91411 RepID=UPI000718CFF8|nr:PREDICTED: maltase A3-like [Polistes canadensis]XP_014609696.1 PREDICTED: maltase A3-like [Polistes canadensis]XP_014609697.1 PREDICTED: maltase A3-like [Polistes canadensis]